MKNIINFYTLLVSTLCCAQTQNPYQELLNAVSECKSPDNPYIDASKRLQGNRMLLTTYSPNTSGGGDFQIVVTKSFGHSLYVTVGRLTLHTERKESHGPLDCKITIMPLLNAPPMLDFE